MFIMKNQEFIISNYNTVGANMLFLKILLTEFIAEMGDKTQLMLIALTSKFKIRDIIIGTATAILVLNGIAVLAGGIVGSLIPAWLIKLVAAAAFLYFAITSLKKEDDEEEDASTKGNFKWAPVTVFCTFFVAELGDKTQLTAMTFGAKEGLSNALVVWLACSIGLFAADILGMLVGYLLKSRMPEGILNILAFFIFSIFGMFTAVQGLEAMTVADMLAPQAVNIILAALVVVFVVVCIIYRRICNKK